MNAKQQYAANTLVDAYVAKLGMTSNAKIHSVIYRALKTKNIDETQRALEFLLQTIVQDTQDATFNYAEGLGNA